MPIFISVAQSEISTTNIDVADVDAAREFFTAGLGFSMRRQASESVVLVAVTLEIWLLSRTQNSCATPESSTSRTYKRHWTPIHLDIIVDDLHSALERAIRAGAIREGDIEADQQGSIAFLLRPVWQWILLDPKMCSIWTLSSPYALTTNTMRRGA